MTTIAMTAQVPARTQFYREPNQQQSKDSHCHKNKHHYGDQYRLNVLRRFPPMLTLSAGYVVHDCHPIFRER